MAELNCHAGFHFRADQKESKKVEKEVKPVENEVSVSGDVKKGAETTSDSKKEKPKDAEKKEDAMSAPAVCERPYQNWCDFMFIMDSLSFSLDMCDLLLFQTKISPVPGLEAKKVSVEGSYLDTASNTLVVAATDSGIIEKILGESKQQSYF